MRTGPLFCAVVLCASACAPTHGGRTLGQGVLQAEGSLGGPMVTNLGPAIPVPNLPLGLRYGINDRLDVAAHLNLLPIIVGGFMVLDTSVTYGLVRHSGRRGWNLAASLGLALMTDFRDEARVAPLADIAGGYTFDWLTLFAGMDVAADLWGGGLLANPFVGFEADIGRVTLSAAFVWFSPGQDLFASSIEYVSANHHGSPGFLLGVKYRWTLRGQ